MRKKSIPFRKFTESFPVFPIFSSIIFIYFTKKVAAPVSLRLFYLQISLLSARHCGIIRSAACSITHREPLSNHSSKTVSSSQCSKCRRAASCSICSSGTGKISPGSTCSPSLMSHKRCASEALTKCKDWYLSFIRRYRCNCCGS